MNKRNVGIVLIIIVAIILGWYWYTQQGTETPSGNGGQVTEPEYTAEELLAMEWETYTNDEFGFSIEYPEVWGEPETSTYQFGSHDGGFPKNRELTDIWFNEIKIKFIKDFTLQEYREYIPNSQTKTFTIGQFSEIQLIGLDTNPYSKKYILEKNGDILEFGLLVSGSPKTSPETRFQIIEHMIETLKFNE